MDLDLVVRAMVSSERAIVANSWIRSYERRRPEIVLPVVWRRGHARVVDALLSRSSVYVAELKDAPGEVLGWACFSGDDLHYAYTKKDYRGAGVCAEVVSSAMVRMGDTVWSTHDTRDARFVRNVVRNAGKKLKLDPWRLFT